MSVPIIQRPFLVESTIVPDPKDLLTFLQYLTRIYENIAFAVNQRDFIFFTMPITDIPTNIPNMPLFGSFIICVSGLSGGLPCLITTVCKNDIYAAGTYVVLNAQSGSIAPWGASALSVQDGPAVATGEIPITINHNVVGVPGSFNLRIIGTQ